MTSLIDVHRYCQASGIHSLSEEMYILSSRGFDWIHQSQSGFDTFLLRFLIHALQNVTPDSPSKPYPDWSLFRAFSSLPSTVLTQITGILATERGMSSVWCTPYTWAKLKCWLPAPDLADFSQHDIYRMRMMVMLLEVARLLLLFDYQGQFRDPFRSHRCLDFWKLAYESHSNIPEDFAQAFGRMIDAYTQWPLHHHHQHIVDHIETIVFGKWRPMLLSFLGIAQCTWST